MQIAIVGTGVIGTLYGWALSQKHEVYHYVRETSLQSNEGRKISYDLIDERRAENNQMIQGSYTYHCQTQISKETDLIIVPVKSFQLIKVLETLKQQTPYASYLLMTLNWEGTTAIDGVLSKEQYILGYAGGGGTFKKELLWGDLGEDLLLGTVYKEQQSLLEKVVQVFTSCGMKPEIPQNMLHTLWMHNIDSAPLGKGLAQYDNMSSFIQDEALIKICFGAMEEAYQIAAQRGVDLSQYPEVEMYKMPFTKLYPLFKNNWETNVVMQRYAAHAVEAIEEMTMHFNIIYDTGRKMGRAMPNMELLKAL